MKTLEQRLAGTDSTIIEPNVEAGAYGQLTPYTKFVERRYENGQKHLYGVETVYGGDGSSQEKMRHIGHFLIKQADDVLKVHGYGEEGADSLEVRFTKLEEFINSQAEVIEQLQAVNEAKDQKISELEQKLALLQAAKARVDAVALGSKKISDQRPPSLISRWPPTLYPRKW